MFSVFFSLLRVSPAPPADQVRDEKENLQKHIRVKLHLEKQKEKKCYVDQPDRPTPDVGTCGKPYRDCSRYRSKKFKITHRVTESCEEDGLVIEEIHRSQLHTNILRFRKKPQRFPATFTPNSTLFHSTKRCAQVAVQPAVHPNDTALYLM